MECKETVHKQMREAICSFEVNADQYAMALTKIKNMPQTDSVIAFKSITETLLTLCYINLDLIAAYRQFLSDDTSTGYENRQSMTKINVVISEGYKKIYGCTPKQQNKSFWCDKIKNSLSFCGEERINEYIRIEALLKDIGNEDILNKKMRDLSVHYDDDPMKVYNMLSSISAEEVINRCGKFMSVLNEVTCFVTSQFDLLENKLCRQNKNNRI